MTLIPARTRLTRVTLATILAVIAAISSAEGQCFDLTERGSDGVLNLEELARTPGVVPFDSGLLREIKIGPTATGRWRSRLAVQRQRTDPGDPRSFSDWWLINHPRRVVSGQPTPSDHLPLALIAVRLRVD